MNQFQCFFDGYDVKGGHNVKDGHDRNIKTKEACQKACEKVDQCRSFAFNTNDASKMTQTDGCWLKLIDLKEHEIEVKENVTIGRKFCPGTNSKLPLMRFNCLA